MRLKRNFLCFSGCLAISMALYAGAWTLLCEKTGMVSWIGFAGCTTYFACGKKNLPGIGVTIATNLSGAAWAMLSMLLGKMWDWPFASALLCAFISYIIIMQAKVKGLGFIPGAYIGCFVTFAAKGEWKAVLPAMLLGPVLGWLAEITGTKLHRKIGA